jgi:hypothetical protein
LHKFLLKICISLKHGSVNSFGPANYKNNRLKYSFGVAKLGDPKPGPQEMQAQNR